MTPADSVARDDCLRVATATILDLNPRRVPHFIRRLRKNECWITAWNEWLGRHQGVVALPFYPTTLSMAPRGFWIAITDEDPTDGWTHAVVMRGRRVAWDPQGDEAPKRRKYVMGFVLEKSA